MGVLLVALLDDQEARARIADAMRGHAELRCFGRLRDAERELARGAAHAVFVTPTDESGTPVLPLIRRLRRGQSAIPIAVYAPLTPEAAVEVVALARAGIDEVILRGHDDLGVSLRALLSRAGSARAATEAYRVLSGAVPSPATSILAYCLEHAQDSLTVGALADALGVHRKTLLNRLAAGALPPPSALISWCRLFIAARLLEDGRRTVEQVALALGFGSGTALRNMFRRYTGLRPAEIRRRGGLTCVATVFRGRAVIPPAW